MRSYLLPESPRVAPRFHQAVRADYARFIERGLPASVEAHLLDRYGIDVAATYAGYDLPNPWGKASGQLSMTAHQVAEDVEAGLGFVVLKTVIAQDETGEQTMQAWAIREARMVAERIVGRSGESGWTISWKGRGWWQSFDEYLALVRDAQRLARGAGTLIVPSCKYHLPQSADEPWKTAEYDFTTRKLLDAWRAEAADRDAPMPLEKDFSPTLAGSDLARQQTQILEWLRHVPQLVRAAAQTPLPPREGSGKGARSAHPAPQPSGISSPSESGTHDATENPPPAPSLRGRGLRVGLKLFNAMFDDAFQLEMLRAIHADEAGRPDFFVYGNRLFDPQREFDGKRGIAYGGPDLSDRNLRIMAEFQAAIAAGEIERPLPWSATGDIHSGRMALEYALRGASSFQIHTYFQLPAPEYRMKTGTKVQKALCELYFHPERGLVVWLEHLAEALDLDRHPLRFREIVGAGPRLPAPPDSRGSGSG
ncbi:MAG: hypothetical protein WED34_00190 [Planctomycetales bacterium]